MDAALSAEREQQERRRAEAERLLESKSGCDACATVHSGLVALSCVFLIDGLRCVVVLLVCVCVC